MVPEVYTMVSRSSGCIARQHAAHPNPGSPPTSSHSGGIPVLAGLAPAAKVTFPGPGRTTRAWSNCELIIPISSLPQVSVTHSETMLMMAVSMIGLSGEGFSGHTRVGAPIEARSGRRVRQAALLGQHGRLSDRLPGWVLATRAPPGYESSLRAGISSFAVSCPH